MKAVVMEMENKNVILLRDDGQFITARNNNYSIGDVIMMNNKSTKKRFLATAAAAAVFVLLLSAGVFAYMTPYYYVSVDVNPSILMKANRFERVISLEAVNDDAKSIISEIDWKNKDIEQVMSETLQELEQEGYFEQASDVLIASTARNNEKAIELAEKLSDETENTNVDNAIISSEVVGYEMVQSAKELGMTPGKYNLITNLLNETIDESNSDEYLNQSVKDLMAKFTATKGVQGKETAAEAKTKDATTEVNEKSDQSSEGKKFAEQKASEAQQAATEQRQEAEQGASEVTQAATEQRQEAEQEASEVTDPSMPIDASSEFVQPEEVANQTTPLN